MPRGISPLAFSRSADSGSRLPQALAAVAAEAAGLLGADRAAIWLHDRRTRELRLAAASGRPPEVDERRVAASDQSSDVARGLTLDRPERVGSTIVAPLRGWRRALGTLIVEWHRRIRHGGPGASRARERHG